MLKRAHLSQWLLRKLAWNTFFSMLTVIVLPCSSLSLLLLLKTKMDVPQVRHVHFDLILLPIIL